MSDYTAISAVSQTLKSLLTANITQSSDNQIKNVPIELLSPRELEEHESLAVSVWLYRVARMSDMLNDPPQRIAPNLIAATPLPLLLHYLVTPVASDALTHHALMGKALQVLNDHSSFAAQTCREFYRAPQRNSAWRSKRSASKILAWCGMRSASRINYP